MSDPKLLIWNRIESNPRGEDLEEALKAEIYDPLWMLSRQWQLGEFQGEDAASAANVRYKYEKYIPDQLRGFEDYKTYYDPREQPIEAVVERTEYEPDLFTRVEIGRQWYRLLEKELSSSDKEAIVKSFRESRFLQFKILEQLNKYQKYEHADALVNEEYQNLLSSLVKEKKTDGGALIDIIANKYYKLSEYILNTDNPEIDWLGDRLLEWAQRVFSIHIGQNAFWSPERLEYQFDMDLPLNQRQKQTLGAEEYFGRGIDWNQFDKKPLSNKLDFEIPNQPQEEKEMVQYPSRVTYPGMPSSRWWEMEDSEVNFGAIKAGGANPASMIFTQFSLIYSNDWLTLPLKLETGALYRIKEMVVTDNFGIQTLVRHIHETAPDENWGLFQTYDRSLPSQNQNDIGLFLPSAVDGLQESEPREEVNFIRDEWANMVWGIENMIPDHLGDGVGGKEYAEALAQFILKLEEPYQSPNFVNEAKKSYQIATTVPENWIPFIPVQIKDKEVLNRQIQLQRASMPRIVNGYKTTRIRPKTFLLREGLRGGPRRPLFIYEEEIPRSGAVLRGRWKRVRWLNGQTYVWYSREKSIGRGEGSSGLRFDFLEDKKG